MGLGFAFGRAGVQLSARWRCSIAVASIRRSIGVEHPPGVDSEPRRGTVGRGEGDGPGGLVSGERWLGHLMGSGLQWFQPLFFLFSLLFSPFLLFLFCFLFYFHSK